MSSNCYFSQNLGKHEFSPQSSQIIFFNSVVWEPNYSIWTDGWSDSHFKIKNHFSEMCESPNRILFALYCKIFTRHVLTFIWLEWAVLINAETLVVNWYDVVSRTPNCWKSDKMNVILLGNSLEFDHLFYFLCGGEWIQITELYFTKLSSTKLWTILQ